MESDSYVPHARKMFPEYLSEQGNSKHLGTWKLGKQNSRKNEEMPHRNKFIFGTEKAENAPGSLP